MIKSRQQSQGLACLHGGSGQSLEEKCFQDVAFSGVIVQTGKLTRRWLAVYKPVGAGRNRRLHEPHQAHAMNGRFSQHLGGLGGTAHAFYTKLQKLKAAREIEITAENTPRALDAERSERSKPKCGRDPQGLNGRWKRIRGIKTLG